MTDVHDQQREKVPLFRDLDRMNLQHTDTQSWLTHNTNLCFLDHFNSLCCMLLRFHLVKNLRLWEIFNFIFWQILIYKYKFK